MGQMGRKGKATPLAKTLLLPIQVIREGISYPVYTMDRCIHGAVGWLLVCLLCKLHPNAVCFCLKDKCLA